MAPEAWLSGRGPEIRAALEAAGVEFTNGEQPGVKLRKIKT
jgi:hypothetical protein